MKIIIYTFIIFSLINNSVTKTTVIYQNPTPTKFVFNKYRALTESGVNELTMMRNSAIDREYNPKGKGTSIRNE